MNEEIAKCEVTVTPFTAKQYREKCAEVSEKRRAGQDEEGNSFNVPYLNFDTPCSLRLFINGFAETCQVILQGRGSEHFVPDSVMRQLRDWLNEKYPCE